mgnify:CR=1 FL=1
MLTDEEAAANSGRSGRAPAGRLRPEQVPALIAALGALGFLVLALVMPDPSRHARGLLVVVNLICVLGVAAAWIRAVRLVGAPSSRRRVE